MFIFLKTILGFAKKAFIIVAVYFAIISLFSFFINKDKISLTKQASIVEQNRKEIYQIINDKKYNSTLGGKLTLSVYRTSMCIMIGEACTDKPSDAKKKYDKSIFGYMSKLIIFPFANPPASGISWAYSGLQSSGFIPKTYAAEGLGFAAIKPYANLWKVFRDLAYMLLVIVLIAIGFMVMFRMKMNPQTVISVENALPKIVIALILITFSFAIAGFLIDLMYVSIILIVSVLSSNNNNYNAVQFQNNYLGASLTQIFLDVSAGRQWFTSLGVLPKLADALFGLFPIWVSTAAKAIVGGIFTVIMFNQLHLDKNFIEPIGKALNNIMGATFGIGDLPYAILGPPLFALVMLSLYMIGTTLVTALLMILIGSTLVLLVFRIFALLFSSYIKLLLLVIIGPFLLMFEAIPGKNIFTSWIKNLIGNLIAFPITIAVFLLGFIIVNSTTPQGYNNLNLPYLNGFDNNSFKILVGIGLMIMIPDLVKVTKEALGIKDLPFNLGIGTFFGGAAAVGGGAMGVIAPFGSLSLALGAIGPGGILGKVGQKIMPNKLFRMLGPYTPPDKKDVNSGSGGTTA